jgi:hypothetical protein
MAQPESISQAHRDVALTAELVKGTVREIDRIVELAMRE